jgi:subtilisin family serine protease
MKTPANLTARHVVAALTFLLLWTMTLEEVHAETYRYRLHLSGKPGASLATLSERSLQRRARQHIALDSTDYTISPLYQQRLLQSGLCLSARSRWLNSVVVERPDGDAIDTTFWEHVPVVTRVDEVSGPGLTVSKSAPLHTRGASDLPEEASLSDTERLDFVQPIYEVRGDALHNANYRGQGMLIAVIDGGFLNTDYFPQINSHIVGYRDLYNPTRPNQIFRTCNHGTQVLSVMSCDSSYGVWGTAPEASYYLIRSENTAAEQPFEEDLWVQAAELADSLGADLINSSLGYSFFDDVIYDHRQSQLATGEVFISRGAKVACAKGMLTCVAAGNERTAEWGTLLFPADVQEVLTVAATDASGDDAYFTSPGFLLPWVKPNVACRGQNSFVIHYLSGQPAYAHGTSYATPLICGLAASLWSAAPSLSAAQIRELICTSACSYARPDSILGYGHPDFSVALEQALALEARSATSLPTLPSDEPAAVRAKGLFDLMGRRLAAPPVSGCYVEDGRLKMVR